MKLVLIAHNLRSSHNVGSLLRTAEGLGVNKVYLTGYTPYPLALNDMRLPHMAGKIDRQIAKTALGAENLQAWEHDEDIEHIIANLKRQGYALCALEQTKNARPLHMYVPTDKTALVVGREVEGIEQAVLDICDLALEIPMAGKKESFNVAQAAAMALFHLTNAARK